MNFQKTMKLEANDNGEISYRIDESTGPLSITIKRIKLIIMNDEVGEAHLLTATSNGQHLFEGHILEGKELIESLNFKAKGKVQVEFLCQNFGPGEVKEFRVDVDYKIGLF